jgi:urease alpha subunit
MKKLLLLLTLGVASVSPSLLHAQQDRLVPAPDRRSGEGQGPFPELTIRNVMVIDGTGAPPAGPMNVVIQRNRIARISSAGTPGVTPRSDGGAKPAGEVIDGTGMFLMPGFVNLHAHLGDNRKAPEAEYVY